MMIKNYLLTAFRHFWKQKSFGLLNVAGLTLGLTTSLLILLWVQDELSYNTMHAKADRIYRIIGNFDMDGKIDAWQGVPAPLGRIGRETIPEVEHVVRFRENYHMSVFKTEGVTLSEKRTAFAEPSVFSVFDFRLLRGNTSNPFPDLYSVVLTASTAKRYFGNEDPVGKVLHGEDQQDFTVSGVMEDFPENSSIRYDMLFNMELFAQKYWSNGYFSDMENDWGNFDHEVYLLLKPGASVDNIEKQLTKARNDHNGEPGNSIFFTLQPLSQIHLYHPDGTEAGIQEVKIFGVVAFVILLIACINYVNLSTARASKRAKEISLRKLIGASRKSLFWQLLAESTLLFVLAVILTLLAADLLMPAYNSLTAKHMVFDPLNSTVISILGVAFVFTVIAAGVYPALLLSGFEPLQTLKGQVGIGSGNNLLRKSLVVVQFTMSLVLIIGTLVISRQMEYVRSKKLGYDRENVLVFSMRNMRDSYNSVRRELLQQPGVIAVTSADQRLVNIGNSTGDTDWEGKVPESMFIIHPMGVDEHFVEDMQLTLATGKNFSGMPVDSSYVILNETAVKETGIKDPIGKKFSLWNDEKTIIGVVKDFHFASIHQEIEPFIFYYLPKGYNMYVKTTGADASKAITASQAQWDKYNAEYPFEYQFLDESFDRLYQSDQRTGEIFNYFAGMAVFVSCLGLFGLAAFAAEQRVKEIGIRKVLGASVGGIVQLFTLDFIKLVVLAIVIASPVAWYLMGRWLNNFAYRVNFGLGVFLLAGALSLLIAFLTVCYHSIRASLANPVESLRDE